MSDLAVIPPGFTDQEIKEFLEYLDELRDSGETNMYGAAPYVADEFGIELSAARKVLKYWMQTYSERHPKETQ